MTGKQYNTKKGRKSLPEKSAVYNLKNRNGDTVYTGMTNNVKRRVGEHYRDKSKSFSSVTYNIKKTRNQANATENRRLAKKRPKYNKKKQ